MYALLFGFRSSVQGFTRFSVFFQSIARRLAQLPMTMFYDDASLQDLSSAKGAGQRLMVKVMRALGGEFKDAKRQTMNTSCDFLGLVHDLSDAFVSGTVSFQPRYKLAEKTVALASAAVEDDCCPPVVAGKLLGIRAF